LSFTTQQQNYQDKSDLVQRLVTLVNSMLKRCWRSLLPKFSRKDAKNNKANLSDLAPLRESSLLKMRYFSVFASTLTLQCDLVGWITIELLPRMW